MGGETYFVDCPFCDHEVKVVRPLGALPTTHQAVRLMERMIRHLEAKHGAK